MRIFLLSAFIVLATVSGFSQNQETVVNPWGSLGFGMYGMADNQGMGFYLGINFAVRKIQPDNVPAKKQNFIFGARYIPFTTMGNENVSGRRVSGIDFLCGVSFGRSVTFRLLTGAGMTHDFTSVQKIQPGIPPMPYWEDEYYNSLNIPLEAGLFINSPGYFGFGFSGFVNLYGKHPFVGFNLRIEIGKLN